MAIAFIIVILPQLKFGLKQIKLKIRLTTEGESEILKLVYRVFH
jgi:hypothetical protein